MKIKIVPVGANYTCPECGIVTSKWCTKLKCDCHVKSGIAISFGRVLHFAGWLKGEVNCESDKGTLESRESCEEELIDEKKGELPQ
jgi:hypothetical protein